MDFGELLSAVNETYRNAHKPQICEFSDQVSTKVKILLIQACDRCFPIAVKINMSENTQNSFHYVISIL